jgi:outer membrane immunogenic protein
MLLAFWGMTMRRFNCAALAAVAVVGFASVVCAADMPMKAAPMVAPVAAYNWTGCYIGANAGGAWGRSNVSETITAAGGAFTDPNHLAVNAADSPTLNPNGFTGGGQTGCNWQTGKFVLGLETDFDYFGLSGSQTATGTFPIGGGTFTVTNSVKTNWLFTARPRLGYAIDTWLPYITGGLAVTQIKYATTYADVTGNTEAAGQSSTRTGWTIGGGLEHVFSQNWTAKIEYLYANFGSTATSGPVLPSNGQTFNHNVSLTSQIVRAGINYKFN